VSSQTTSLNFSLGYFKGYQSVNIDYIGICKHFVFVNLEMRKKKEYILGVKPLQNK